MQIINTTEETVVRIAELEIDPNRIVSYLAFLKEEVQASLELEPGVLALHAVQFRDAPHMVRLLEVYETMAAYEAHIQTAHFLKYKNGTADMVMSLRLIDTLPVVLASK